MKKRNWYSILIVGLMLLLLSSFTAACSSQSQVDQAGETPSGTSDLVSPVTKGYADFEVGPLTVVRSGATVNEMVTVSATVTNSGDVSGTYSAVLLIDGKETSQKDVAVGPKGAENVVFQVSKATPGSYKIAIGESAAVLNVYEWPYKIQYDLGDWIESPLSVAGEYGHIVHFSPPAVPFKIQKIDISARACVTKDSDWDNRYITVRIWDEERGNVLWSNDFRWQIFWSSTLQSINVPNISVDGDFYVEVITHSEQFGGEIMNYWTGAGTFCPGVFLAWDRPNPYVGAPATPAETRSGVSSMGKPVEVPVKYQGINWFIRAEGDGSI